MATPYCLPRHSRLSGRRMRLSLSRIMTMGAAFKLEAHKLVNDLPETANWDDLIYRAVVFKEIEAGLADSTAARVTVVEEVLREFGLAE